MAQHIPVPPAVTGEQLIAMFDLVIMTGPSGKVHLLSENLEFCEDGIAQMLIEPSNFLVVGVIGLQGAGKSTILSSLFGGLRSHRLIISSRLVQIYRRFFPPQSLKALQVFK